MSADTEKALMDNLHYIRRESSSRIISFFKNQIATKGGKPGMESFKAMFHKYDDNKIWTAILETHFDAVMRYL